MKERKRGTCYNYVDVQFSVGVCQCRHIFVHIYVFAKGCAFVPLSVCAGGEWESVVCLCVEGPGCSPDQLGTAMVHV